MVGDRFDRATGRPLGHAFGGLGEDGLAHWGHENGFAVMYGPSGTQRAPRDSPHKVHQPTTKGLDAILYRSRDNMILVLDNKADAAAKPINDATAFTENLRQKINDRIGKLEAAKVGLPAESADKLSHFNATIAALRRAERALDGKEPWPSNVRFGLANAGGNATGVSRGLAQTLRMKGIKHVFFIDFNQTVPGTNLKGRIINVHGLAPEVGPSFRSRISTKTRVRRLVSSPVGRLALSGLSMAATMTSLINSAHASPGTATAAALLNPLGLVKDWMVDGIKALPKPSVDRRDPGDVMLDPESAKSLKTLDLFYKDVQPFSEHLAAHHQKVQEAALADVFRLLARAQVQSEADCITDLQELHDELNAYTQELQVISNNIDTVRGLEPDAIKAADGAEKLIPLFENIVFQDQLIKRSHVIDYNDIADMPMRLRDFAHTTRNAFRQFTSLGAQVEKQLREMQSLEAQITKQSWGVLLTPLINPPIDPHVLKDEEVVLSVLPDDIRRPMPLAEIRRRVREVRGDFIPSVENVLTRLENQGRAQRMEGPGIPHGKAWYRIDGHKPGGLHKPTHD